MSAASGWVLDGFDGICRKVAIRPRKKMTHNRSNTSTNAHTLTREASKRASNIDIENRKS